MINRIVILSISQNQMVYFPDLFTMYVFKSGTTQITYQDDPHTKYSDNLQMAGQGFI